MAAAYAARASSRAGRFASEDWMIATTCHCGQVTVEIPRPPESLTNCDCSICRRYGTLWAYYRESEVRISAAPGSTNAYSWGRKSLRFVRCATCGCITHWERNS